VRWADASPARGRFLFGYFFLATARKSDSPAGERAPGETCNLAPSGAIPQVKTCISTNQVDSEKLNSKKQFSPVANYLTTNPIKPSV
jgi:hypothetical protein